jgi:TonB family protein
MTSITSELSAISVRTHRMMYASTIVHVLLLAWLLLHQTVVAEPEGLTEITFLEVAAPLPEPAAPPVARDETKRAPTQEVALERASRQEPVEHFQRTLVRSQVEPVPQKKRATEDVLTSRLSSLQRNAREKDTKISQLVPPPNVGAPSLAGIETDMLKKSTPTELERDKKGRPAPIDLPRVRVPTMQNAAVIPTVISEAPSSPRATLDRSSSRRVLAGAQLVGPVADRELVSHAKPVYPEWAKQEGVEASVTIYFLVLPDGRVKENVLVDKTSGFGDFDENAVDAIGKWRFEAVSGTQEQWGTITFNFRLTDGS